MSQVDTTLQKGWTKVVKYIFYEIIWHYTMHILVFNDTIRCLFFLIVKISQMFRQNIVSQLWMANKTFKRNY